MAKPLWYLLENLVSLAFHEHEVFDDLKSFMVEALANDGDAQPATRVVVELSTIYGKTLTLMKHN